MTALDHVENVCLCRESTNSDHEEKKSCSQPLLPPTPPPVPNGPPLSHKCTASRTRYPVTT